MTRLPKWPQPDVIRLGTRKWKLRREYVFYDEELQRLIVIPAGFIYDLASVPRVVWSLISPLDLGEIGALLHDWIYRHAGRIPYPLRPDGMICNEEPYTRSEADDLFRRVMIHDQVKARHRRWAYTAVRVAGWQAWGKTEPVIEPVTPEEMVA